MSINLFGFAVALILSVTNFSFGKNMEEQITRCRLTLEQRASQNPQVMQMFDETVTLWHQHFIEQKGEFDLATLLKAVAFAAAKHEGGRRKDAAKTPYIIHPIAVARSLWEEGGIRSVNVLVAALLHDTIEDTGTKPEEIKKLFGKRVCTTVQELSNDPDLSRDENKQRQVDHAPEMSLDAQLVKLADRLCNIRDLRCPPLAWSRAQVLDYLGWGEKLLKALKGTHSELEKLLVDEIASQQGQS